MDEELSARGERILQEAMLKPPRDRESFLSEACENDTALFSEIAGRLRGQEVDEFLEHGLKWEDFQGLATEGAASEAATRLGPYRVLREIGRGGVGRVYLAKRDDHEFDQVVAIKLLQPGMASEHILRRFRNERQILAGIKHSYVAQLLDGGSTETGQPYFVMEYIEGRPIDEYCDACRLTTTERLKLFREVCSAVQFAHQNLVVHRDIKPGNILITSDGVPKLLDFGIAKILKPELSNQTLDVTELGSRILTPQYASPEQVLGKPMTTATDVYSLGVLLYELLTGCRPYRITSREEMETLVCTVEPTRPSARIQSLIDGASSEDSDKDPDTIEDARATELPALRRQLGGDLDNIVSMATRKEPIRRYPSVQQLSDDIGRHLDGHPVDAAQDSVSYRIGKFVRRHRVGVLAACVTLGALVTGLAAATVGFVRATNAERKAGAINQFLTDTLRASDPSLALGELVTVRQILDGAAAELESNPLSREPDIMASLHSTLGTTYMSLAEYPTSRAQLDSALALQEKTLGRSHADTIRTRTNLTIVSYHLGLRSDDDLRARETLRLAEGRLGKKHPATLRAMFVLALVLSVSDKTDEAEALYLECLEHQKGVLGEEHFETLETMRDLAALYSAEGRGEDAEPLYLESIRLSKHVHGEMHPDVVDALTNLSFAYNSQGRLAEAERASIQAAELSGRLYGDEKLPTLQAKANLAGVFRGQGKYDDAKALYQDVIPILERDMPTSEWRVRTLMGYGILLTQTEQYCEAQSAFQEARTILPQDGTLDGAMEAYLQALDDAWDEPEAGRRCS